MLLSVLASTRLSRQDLEAREDAGYASLELPGDSTLSLPTLDTAENSDDLISPYASFSSTADRPTPLLSGWLDKLSPQGWGCWEGKGREGREAGQWGGSGLKYPQILGAPQMQPPPCTDLGRSLPQKLRLSEALCAVQREESDVLRQR